MKKVIILTSTLILASILSSPARSLDIYFIDMLGGAATLIATPAGETVLIDTGWPRDDHRDAKRIYDAIVNQAGLKQIDYLITTHWHRDHFGEVLELSRMLPIGTFYDRGIDPGFSEDKENYDIKIAEYQKATKGKSIVLDPGDVIPLKQNPGSSPVKLTCVASHRDVIESGGDGKKNPLCQENEQRPYDDTDNAESVSVLLTFGDFQFLCAGDITWNVEARLVCPTNRIGQVDLYMVNHHGLDISNNPLFLRSIEPVASVICNGPRKGCSPKTVERLRALPTNQAIYQLHKNVRAKAEENTDLKYIANPDPERSGQYIKATVSQDTKSFKITIGEDGMPITYKCK